MPLRTIVLENGSERSRNVTNLHPDGTEFLPEQISLPADTAEGGHIYKALERLINSAAENKNTPRNA